MHRRRLTIVLLTLLVAAASACGGGGDDSGDAEGVTPPDSNGQTTADDAARDEIREDIEATTSEALPYQETIDLTIDDVQAFYSVELPVTFGFEYSPIPDDQILPYTSGTDEFGACFEGASYEDVAGNAFYCSLDGTVRFDNETLFPELHAQFGPFALAVVLAHEWGHVVQDQTGFFDQASVLVETQADCLAGAWVGHIDAGESTEGLELLPGDLEVAVAGMIHFRDPLGSDPSTQGAHGSGFDRVASFQRGFEDGLAGCESWRAAPPAITESLFNDQEDFESGGNAPLEEVFDFVPTDLDAYWTQVFSLVGVPYDGVDDVVAVDTDTDTSVPCADAPDPDDIAGRFGYCESDDLIIYDADLVDIVYEDIGDFGVAVLLSNAWATAMQSELDATTGDALAVSLQADCFSGAWTGSVFFVGHDTGITLSPGDLDEVVQAFLSFGAEAGGTGFQRVQAFRIGFFSENAEAVCAAITEGEVEATPPPTDIDNTGSAAGATGA